jgi:alpha-glucuronidase
MQLKDTIFNIFKGWDTTKSFWENMKNMADLIKNAIIDWWNESSFKNFYEKNLKPFVDSTKDLFKRLDNLGGFIKQAISDWWNGDSSLGETLTNIGTTIKNAVIDWWNESSFKKFYEKNLKPFVDSTKDLFNRLSDLGGFIKKAISDWWNGDSSFGETLTNIGTTIKNAVAEWWDTSVFKTFWDETVVPLIDEVKVYF